MSEAKGTTRTNGSPTEQPDRVNIPDLASTGELFIECLAEYAQRVYLSEKIYLEICNLVGQVLLPLTDQGLMLFVAHICR